MAKTLVDIDPAVLERALDLSGIRTKKELDIRGVKYTEIDLEADPKALAYVQSLGHQAAPVVILEDGTSWASLRPDLINEHFGKRPTK